MLLGLLVGHNLRLEVWEADASHLVVLVEPDHAAAGQAPILRTLEDPSLVQALEEAQIKDSNTNPVNIQEGNTITAVRNLGRKTEEDQDQDRHRDRDQGHPTNEKNWTKPGRMPKGGKK